MKVGSPEDSKARLSLFLLLSSFSETDDAKMPDIPATYMKPEFTAEVVLFCCDVSHVIDNWLIVYQVNGVTVT